MMTSFVGLSLALGAFMAGLIISESEYSHQAISNVLPFREIFSAIFFISIGMLLDIGFLIENFVAIIGFTILVIGLKTVIASLAGFALKYPPRIAIHTGLLLFQVGEFAFILSKTGIEYGLVSADVYQYFLSVSIISMAVTPFVVPRADDLVSRLLNLPIARPIQAFSDLLGPKINVEQLSNNMEDHLIIIGFGINGQNVARAARFANIPYIIIEVNAETVKKEREKGEPILYGDAANAHLLEHAQIAKARIVVIAISDPEATKKIIAETRMLTKTAFILVRTRFVKEVEQNLLLGADEVIPEEFETSIQIFVRVLKQYFVPQDSIQQLVDQIRDDNYDFLRPEDHPMRGVRPAFDSDINVAAIRIDNHYPGIVGKTVHEAEVRKNYGVNIVAIRKEDKVIQDIGPDVKIENMDVLYVSGEAAMVRMFSMRVCDALKN